MSPQLIESPAVPGADLVETGLADLRDGRLSIESMLVLCAKERVRALGHSVPDITMTDPEVRLYALVAAEVGERQAHSRYNALRRRLTSYLRAMASTGADVAPAG